MSLSGPRGPWQIGLMTYNNLCSFGSSESEKVKKKIEIVLSTPQTCSFSSSLFTTKSELILEAVPFLIF